MKNVGSKWVLMFHLDFFLINRMKPSIMQKNMISFKRIQKQLHNYQYAYTFVNISIREFSAHTIGQWSEEITLWAS